MRCIIIEDDKIQRTLLASSLRLLTDVTSIEEFDNPIPAIEYLKNNSPDVILLDVEMPNMNGMEFLQYIDEDNQVIIISSHESAALESYKFGVLDYLIKPVQPERLKSAIARVDLGRKDQYFFVKQDGILHKLAYESITHLEAANEYVRIHTKKERYIMLSSLSDLEGKFPNHFFRCHRSFMVNLHAVDKIDGHVLKLSDKEARVSKTLRKELLDRLGT